MNRSLRRQGVVHAGRGAYVVTIGDPGTPFIVIRDRSQWVILSKNHWDLGLQRRRSARDAIRDILRWWP